MSIKVTVKKRDNSLSGDLPCITKHSSYGIGILTQRANSSHVFIVLQPTASYLIGSTIENVDPDYFQMMNDTITLQNQ